MGHLIRVAAVDPSARRWWHRYELGRFLEATLVRPVPRDHRQSDAEFRRRRIVAAITLAVGASLLGLSLNLEPGDPRFFWWTAALATVWTVGAFASGPLHLGWAHTRAGRQHARPLVQPLALGGLAIAVFSAAAAVAAQVPWLRAQMTEVLAHASYSTLAVVLTVTLTNGLAEELFFRGGLYAAIGERHAVGWSTALYAMATVTTGNPMLVLAALVLGTLVGLQRRVTGGVLAPIVTHLTWSLGMLFILPRLLSAVS